MIAYRDFRPEAAGGIVPKPDRIREKFAAALADANRWIESESVDVLNVETLGLHDSTFEARAIRIWYRAADPKPPAAPEV